MALRFFSNVDPDSAFGVIGRLFRDTGRRYAVGYGVATFFMVLVAGSLALSAWIIQSVVDEVFVNHRLDQLIFLAGAVVAISVVRGIGTYGSAVALARVGNSIVARVQRQMFDHLMNLGLDFYARMHSSDMITRMSLNARAAADVLNTVMTSLGRDLLSVIALVTVMIIQSPWMTFIVLIIGPPAIIGVSKLVKQVREVAKTEFRSVAEVIASMQESAQGIRIVKAFGLESIMRSRMNAAIEGVRTRANKMATIKARTGPLMETLGGFAVAGVMLWAGYEAIYFNRPPGAFMSFITAILLAYEPAKRLANTRVQIEFGIVGARLMYKLLDTKPTMETNPDGPELAIDGGEVVFEKVYFTYWRGAKVLRKFDLRAPPRKVTALVGPSGSGKSTIMALIERFYDVNGGTITIDGQDIAKVRLASLRSQLALVSQDTVLFRASIRDNIRFGRPSASDAEVEEAARNAMAHDFIMATTDGYETMLEDDSARLSGGQAQRIAIARAMLRDPRILLLDEATSSLDSESEHQVQIAFDRLMRGRTTIVIAHRLSTILSADQISVVVDGKVVEEGKHADLIAGSSQYARLYHLQFEKGDGKKGEDEAKVEAAE